MPIYEYRCATCGFQKEYLQRLSDAPLTDCPECGKSSLAKMLTAAGFHLKGSGWYVTDFKHGKKQPAKPESDATAKPAEATAAKADDKPAADSKPAVEAPSKKTDADATAPSAGAVATPVTS